MCEFCTKHGDGQVWFRNAANYANDLLADLERRKYMKEFLASTMEKGIVTIGRLETLHARRGSLPAKVVESFVSQAKTDHFGQVVTIEDIREILGKAATVVRIPCACKWATSRKESRSCYSISFTAEPWYQNIDMGHFGLPQDEGLEAVTRQEAISQIEGLGKMGAVHTLWTMKTPFIGAICNCEPADCLGLRSLSLGMETMFPGEQFARVNSDLCDGCGACEDRCHFGAIASVTVDGEQKALIDRTACYGCGLCRHACPDDAITMVDRV